MRTISLRHVAAGIAVAALASCTSLLPAYETPHMPVPSSYPADEMTNTAAFRGTVASVMTWQAYFTDSLLQRLIATALDNNRDLRAAALRIEEARAGWGIRRADRFPSLGVSIQGARARVPGDLNISGQSIVSGEYRAEVGLSSWELDLWGRVRNLEVSALQSWLATDAAHQAVRVALISHVADAYLGLRELDERVAIARQTVASRAESVRIFRRRYETGAGSKLELAQVQTLFAQARSLHAELEQARANQLNAMAFIIGSDPRPLMSRGLQVPFDETVVLVSLQPGLPSELLVTRPDVIASEHRLRAAHADIAAARAAFFPRVALTGNLGTASAELNGLFDSGSRAWAFVPTLSLPIFDGGRRRAGYDVAEVRRDIAVAEYEKTVQTAFREVADALASRHWQANRLESQRELLAAQTERARLAQLRYDNGSATFLEVLDAQRNLLEAEQQLVQTRRSLLSSEVALYAALGGGVNVATEHLPSSSSIAPVPVVPSRQGVPEYQ